MTKMMAKTVPLQCNKAWAIVIHAWLRRSVKARLTCDTIEQAKRVLAGFIRISKQEGDRRTIWHFPFNPLPVGKKYNQL